MLRLHHVPLTSSSEDKAVSNKKTESRLKEVKDLLNETSKDASLAGNGHQVKLLSTCFIEDRNALLLAFSEGTLVWIFLTQPSFNVESVYIDRYLTCKIPHNAVDIVYRDKEGIFISYSRPKFISVFFPTKKSCKSSNRLSRTSLNPSKNFKMKYREPLKIVQVNLEVKSNERKNNRTFFFNQEPRSHSLLGIFWESTSSSTLSPWTAPCRPDANLLVYSYEDMQVDLIAFASFQETILKSAFSKSRRNQVLVLTKGSPVSSLSLDYVVCEIDQEASVPEEMFQVLSVHIPVMHAVVDVDFTEAQDKLMILCEDGNLLMFNLNDNAVYPLKTSPTSMKIMCSSLDAFFLICSDQGQLTMYDYTLTPVPVIYDKNEWHVELPGSLHSVQLLDNLVLLNNISDDNLRVSHLNLVILPSCLNIQNLIHEYLRHNLFPEAISNLLTLNWNFNPYLAYTCLNIVFNFLMKQPLDFSKESQIEATLAAYFQSKQPLELSVEREYKLGMNMLAKRFFYHLVRHDSLQKAYLLAFDLKSKPLFYLLRKIAEDKGDSRLTHNCSEKINGLTRLEDKRRSRREKTTRVTEMQEQHTRQSSQTHSSFSSTSSAQHARSQATVGDSKDVTDVAATRRRPIPAPRRTSATPPLPPGQTLMMNTPHPYEDHRRQTSSQNAPPVKPRLPFANKDRQANSSLNRNSPAIKPPALPPRVRTLATETKVVSPVNAEVRGSKVSITVLEEEQPPPLPPKNFGNNNNHVSTDKVLPILHVVSTSVASSLNRKTDKVSPVVSNTRSDLIRDPPNPSNHHDNTKTEGKDSKPRIECIEFGVV